MAVKEKIRNQRNVPANLQRNSPMLHRKCDGAFLRDYKVVALAVAACFGAGGSISAYANPTNPAVVNGAAKFTTAGNLLTVTNTPNAIINWGSFSIGANEITKFVQQSASSAVLNRVVGQDPSAILGALQSNGRVFLINPNGIVFGAGSQINVGGLVASTMNLSNEDFLAGRLRFNGGLGNSVINQGNITTPQGGNVYLIGNAVTNNGIITSPKGEVVLAAGNSVELVNPGTPDLRVEVTAPNNQALNLGSIVAESGRVGIYAGLINQSGTINANSVMVGENGQITLKSSKNIDLAAGSVTTANGPSGGKIDVQAGDTTLVSGVVEAKGQQLSLPFGDDEAGKGGEIKLLGNLVGLTGNARVDASGESGGGTVLVGGDFQGKNPNVQNAFRTYVGEDVSIKADAITSGNGGKVVVWGDDVTRYYGNISARGGAQAGNGGNVEVSGKVFLDYDGRANTSAPFGTSGTLLLDPADLQIVNTTDNLSGGSFSGGIFSGATGTAIITWATVGGQLSGNNVILTTTGTGGAGNITVKNTSGVSLAGGGKNLTFLAHNDITVDPGADINFSSLDAQLRMVAGWDGVSTASPNATSAASPNATSGVGNILLNGNNVGNTSSGTVSLTAGNSITMNGGLVYSDQTGGKNSSVSLQSVGGNIALNGGFLHARSSGAGIASVGLTAAGSIDIAAASTVKAESGGASAAVAVSSSAAGVTVQGGSDLTGFFCARLNVVFFNLEEGVYGWRTRSMARSRRS